ncbi:hypothetical protein CPC08DRAFT_767739 [Agrocybe pediades]|nr:hypothetical protein CPC08DRAFT_767739 [Agrocybe pediades]
MSHDDTDERPSSLNLLIFAFASSTTAIPPPPNLLFRSIIRQQDVWCTFSGINFARDLVGLLVDSRTSLNLVGDLAIAHPRRFMCTGSSAAVKGKDRISQRFFHQTLRLRNVVRSSMDRSGDDQCRVNAHNLTGYPPTLSSMHPASKPHPQSTALIYD